MMTLPTPFSDPLETKAYRCWNRELNNVSNPCGKNTYATGKQFTPTQFTLSPLFHKRWILWAGKIAL
jgi:hypothetical protein